MPCWTVSTAKVKLSETTDANLLLKAMESLGISAGEYQLNGTELVVTGQRTSADFTAQVKVAYSKQVVMSQAKRFGWQVKEGEANSFTIQKGSF